MKQALEGVRVIDLTQVLAGPYCTMVLGDMGADVIKVEKAAGGDDTRRMGPYTNGESHNFMMVNRNKRGVCLDLKTAAGHAALLELVKTADVFIENYRPNVTKKLGIDFDTLKEINPSLVYCSISGYGQTGPYSHKGGYDIMAQGLGGFMDMTGEKDGKPVKVGIAINDIAAAQTAIQSILAAYIHRLKTGEGQYIDVSLVDSGLAWTVWEAAAYFGAGEVATRNGSAHRVSAPYQGYEAADGTILIGAGNQKLWEAFCREVVEQPDWISRPEYATNSSRNDHAHDLEKDIESVLGAQPSAYWLEKLEAAGIPCSPILSYDETLQDPHIQARGMIQEYEHPLAGTVQTLGFPAKFSGTPGTLRRPAPLLGEHNAEVFAELGYSTQQIDEINQGQKTHS